MKTTIWVLLFLCATALFAEVLFYDNFNRANGAVGNGWANIGSATTAIENNTLKITSPNGTGIKRDFSPITSGVVYIQYDWKVVSTGWYADAFPTGLISHLVIDGDANLFYDLDGTMINPEFMREIGLNTYATIRMKIDLDTDTFSVWVNGLNVAYNIAGNSISSLSSFTFRGLGASTVQYVDNFILMNNSGPADFTATGHLNDIELFWSPSAYPEIVTYQVLRDTTSPANIILTELPGTQNTFTDTSAEPNTDYFYRIRAIMGGSVFTDYAEELTAHLQPQIIVTPQNITFNVGYGYSDSTYVTIGNTGNYTLDWCIEGIGRIPTDGLAIYYPLSGNANDESGNNNNGIVNGPILTVDRFGEANSAYLFNGTTDEIISPDLGIVNNFTFSCWIDPIDIHEIDPEGGGEGNGQRFVLFPAHGSWTWGYGHVGVGMSAGTNGISIYEHADSYFPAVLVWQGELSGWNMVTVTCENHNYKLFINGELVRERDHSTANTLHAPFLIGGIGLPGWPYIPFPGGFDDYTLYRRALSNEEITRLYTYSPYTTEPYNGILQCNETTSIKLIVKGSIRSIGSYSDTLFVVSNDSESTSVPMVINTNILPPNPVISPDPLIINLNEAHPTWESTLQLHNQGQGKLVYALSGTDCYPSNSQLPEVQGFNSMGIYDNHAYYISTNEMTWHEAKTLCEEVGGHLVTISDDQENSFVHQNTIYETWIGFTDEGHESMWTWISGEPTTYQNWMPGEPNNGGTGEHWAHIRWMGYESRWNDSSEDDPFYAVLEYDNLCESSMSFNPDHGSIESGGSDWITLTLTCSSLCYGVYNTSICINQDGLADNAYIPVTINVDFTPPLIVEGLAIDSLVTNDDQIGFTWFSNSIADSVVSYKIYRRGANETEWQLKATVPSSQLAYVDSDFGDFVDTYQFYRVRAVDWVGNISAVGDSVMGALDRYLSPENIVIQAVANRDIHLCWDPVTETISGTPGIPSCYVIYKSQYPSPITDFDFLWISYTNEFTHPWALHFQPLNRLFYMVTAYGGDMGRMQALLAEKRNWKYGELEQALQNKGVWESEK